MAPTSTTEERLATLEERWRGHNDVHALEVVALKAYKEALDHRLEGLNDVRVRFLDKGIWTVQYEKLSDEIKELRESRATSSGEKGIVEKVFASPLIWGIVAFLLGHLVWK